MRISQKLVIFLLSLSTIICMGTHCQFEIIRILSDAIGLISAGFTTRFFMHKTFKSTTPTQSIGVQCSTFRTVWDIRHGCRLFQTGTSFLLCKKLAVKNVQGCRFLTRWLQSGFNTLYYDAERCRGRQVLNPPRE